MSVTPADGSLPLPAALRTAPKAQQDAWRAGAGFEELLVKQLLQPIVDDLDAGAYADQLTDAMAGAVMQGGGLGLASELGKGLDSTAEASA